MQSFISTQMSSTQYEKQYITFRQNNHRVIYLYTGCPESGFNDIIFMWCL